MSESKRNDESGPRWKVIDFNEIEVGERISGGGVGEIHLGKWNGKEVALKTLFDPRINEDLKQEFMNELIVMSRLKHSNIVSLLGASTVSPNLCIVMELCEYSVSDMLYKEGIRPSSYDIVQMMVF